MKWSGKSKTAWVGLAMVVVGYLQSTEGLFPEEWGGYVTMACGALTFALRFATGEPVSILPPKK